MRVDGERMDARRGLGHQSRVAGMSQMGETEMKIMETKEKIKSLVWPDDSVVEVFKTPPFNQKRYAESIEAYEENGEMCNVVWFYVVWHQGGTARYNSKYIAAVIYE